MFTMYLTNVPIHKPLQNHHKAFHSSPFHIRPLEPCPVTGSAFRTGKSYSLRSTVGHTAFHLFDCVACRSPLRDSPATSLRTPSRSPETLDCVFTTLLSPVLFHFSNHLIYFSVINPRALIILLYVFSSYEGIGMMKSAAIAVIPLSPLHVDKFYRLRHQ